MTWTNNGWYIKSSCLVGTYYLMVLFYLLSRTIKWSRFGDKYLRYLISSHKYAEIDFVTNEADTVGIAHPKLQVSPVLWIRIHLAVVDPDPYWECGCWSGSRSIEIDQTSLISLVSCLYRKQCCGSGTGSGSVKIRNFWPDPDPIRNRNKHFGSGFGYGFRIRIRIRIRNKSEKRSLIFRLK